uniref:Uncharacterized protein n=1 Tax=Anguilla anguilla TaxID=7936 RepID=A0A0E9REL2_ANGAN
MTVNCFCSQFRIPGELKYKFASDRALPQPAVGFKWFK